MAIAVRSDLDVDSALFKIKGKSALAEILSVVLTSKSGKKICFSTLYRVGNLGAENLSEVKRQVLSISSSKSLHKHIFVGDFNLPNISWPSGTSTCSDEKGFLEIFDDFCFLQLINEPTHILGTHLTYYFVITIK